MPDNLIPTQDEQTNVRRNDLSSKVSIRNGVFTSRLTEDELWELHEIEKQRFGKFLMLFQTEVGETLIIPINETKEVFCEIREADNKNEWPDV